MKIISKEEAIKLIKDGDFVGTAGFVGCDVPETLFTTCEEQFLATGHPCDDRCSSAPALVTARQREPITLAIQDG